MSQTVAAWLASDHGRAWSRETFAAPEGYENGCAPQYNRFGLFSLKKLNEHGWSVTGDTAQLPDNDDDHCPCPVCTKDHSILNPNVTPGWAFRWCPGEPPI